MLTALFLTALLLCLLLLFQGGGDGVRVFPVKVHSIERLDPFEYHLDVEFNTGARQQYRGLHRWQEFPKGRDVRDEELAEWLDQYVLEWSRRERP